MHLTVIKPELPVPAQLPLSPATFTGRSGELAALDGIGHLAVISGVGGIGKTSLATRWLHDRMGQYPDGALYADLAGHDPKGAASPGDVLAGFLAALGVAAENIPVALDEQAKLFRSVTSGRRMLMLLDNAASAAQVRALLPGAAPSVVLVTTRWRLTGLALDGARFVELGPLDEESSIGIIAKMAGTARTDAEPTAARDVARLCAGHPLAICVVGAQLAMRPYRSVGRLAADLASERDRLATLSITGDVSVRGAFDSSYETLSSQVARFYRMLSLLFAADFGNELAAAHTGVNLAEAAAMLDSLTGANLLIESAGGRFKFHDLVRLHARQRAETDSEQERSAAIQRAVDWYLREAVVAEKVIAPGRYHLNPMYQDTEPPRHAGPADALAWMESEMTGLVAAVHAAHDNGLHERAWQLCEALWGLFSRRRFFRRWLDTHRTGLASAIACADKPAEARMRVRLGLAYLSLGRHDAAEAEFTQAFEVARQAGHEIAESAALEQLGLLRLAEGRTEDAIGCFGAALDICHRSDLPRSTLIMTRHLADAYRDAGRYEQAINSLRQARELSIALGDRFLEGRSLASLGRTYMKANQPARAIAALEEALEIVTLVGGTYEQARTRTSLADVAIALGRVDEARAHLTASLAIYSDLGAPEAEAVGRLLAEIQ